MVRVLRGGISATAVQPVILAGCGLLRSLVLGGEGLEIRRIKVVFPGNPNERE